MQTLSNDAALEVASFVALWLAIHCGDPGPSAEIGEEKVKEIIAHITATLSSYSVALSKSHARTGGIEHSLAKLGFKPTHGLEKTDIIHAPRCVTTPFGVVCVPAGRETVVM